MKKRVIALLLAAAMFVTCMPPASAHERKEHDSELEWVLFGDRNYKNAHSNVEDIIQALEDAVYLAVDQYNGNGKKELENLRSMGVRNLPRSIDEFDFSGNYAHRKYTHRGWDLEYSEKAHWPIRKSILTNTVQKVLFDAENQPLSWFPWLSEKVYSTPELRKQRDSFCALLYYVHILGDHIEAEKYTQLAYVAPLTQVHDAQNPGIIPDIEQHLSVVFASQKASFTYAALMGELDNLKLKAEKLDSSTGGVNTPEKFEKYHQCAEELLKTLSAYVPQLLKNEPFFSNHFK